MKEGELCRICEKADADAWADMLDAAPTAFRRTAGISSARVGDIIVGAAGNLDIVAMNRSVGIGLNGPPASEEIDTIVRHYESAGSRRYAVQLCPTASRPELLDALKERDFTHFNNWTKLIRKATDDIPATASPLRVERIGPDQAADFAAIVCPAFSWPGVVKEWVRVLVGRPGWQHYLAYENGSPIGTGAMYTKDGIAWLGFAATDEAHRRKGIQGVLIEKRLHDAREMGCTSVVVETAEEKADKPNSSFHNLLRFGFKVAYQRPNYIRFRREERH